MEIEEQDDDLQAAEVQELKHQPLDTAKALQEQGVTAFSIHLLTHTMQILFCFVYPSLLFPTPETLALFNPICMTFETNAALCALSFTHCHP